MTVDRTSPVKFLHSWNSFIYDISTNMIASNRSQRSHWFLPQINPIISWSIRSNVSNNSTVSDLMSHLISYLCSFLIWSNRIVIDVVSFKDTIKKTLKIGPFVSGHQEPSYDAAVFNTKGIDWIQHKIYYLRLLIGQSNTRTSASSLLQFGICCRITDACISLSTLGIATRRFPDISHLDA